MGSLSTNFFSSKNKIVNLVLPHDMDTTGLTTSTCDIFDMGKYDRATIIIQLGVVNDSANLGTLTVEKCTNVGGSNNTAMEFTYRTEGTAGGDTLDAITEASSSGIDLTAALGVIDGTMVVIEIRAEEMQPGVSAATNYHCISVLLGCSSHSVFVSAVAILSGARYQNSAMPTAIV